MVEAIKQFVLLSFMSRISHSIFEMMSKCSYAVSPLSSLQIRNNLPLVVYLYLRVQVFPDCLDRYLQFKSITYEFCISRIRKRHLQESAQTCHLVFSHRCHWEGSVSDEGTVALLC